MARCSSRESSVSGCFLKSSVTHCLLMSVSGFPDVLSALPFHDLHESVRCHCRFVRRIVRQINKARNVSLVVVCQNCPRARRKQICCVFALLIYTLVVVKIVQNRLPERADRVRCITARRFRQVIISGYIQIRIIR